MSKKSAILAAALLASACATAPGPMVENGYPTGSLAVAAIQRGDWARAEALLLAEGRLDKADPARLINLGRVYAATGRTDQAISMWQTALAADRHSEVETLNGGLARTDDIARQAIARHASLVTASR